MQIIWRDRKNINPFSAKLFCFEKLSAFTSAAYIQMHLSVNGGKMANLDTHLQAFN